jgi:hypothetical protein
MRRRLSRHRMAQRRRGRRFMTAGLLVLGVALVIAVVARVALLRTAIDAALAAQGFSDVRYEIATVGLTTTRLVDLHLGEELAAKELSLRYSPLQLTRLQVDEVDLTGLQLDLSGVNGASPGPLARLLTRNDGDGAAPAAGLPDLPPIHLSDGMLRLPGELFVNLDDLRLTRGDGETAYDLSVKTVEIARQNQAIALNGLSASVAPTSPGLIVRFTVAALRHAVPDPLVAPLGAAGTVIQEGAEWRLKVSLSAAGGAKLTMTGLYDGKAESAEGQIVLPATNFVPGGLQPGTLAPSLAVLQDVSGTVEGHVGFHWQGNSVKPDGALRFDHFGFRVDGAPVEDMSAQIALAGDTTQPVVRVADVKATIAGTVLAIDDAVLRPLAETNRLTLRAHDVDLGQLLAALDVEGVSGEGHLAGQIPLVLSGGTIAVEGGKLETQGDGRLQIKSADAAAALAQGGADTDLLMQALSDFRYEKLALMIDKPLTGESHLSLKTLGHNPAVLDGHPFQINITVATDLDKILAGVASGGRLSQEIIRAIVGADR